MTPKELTLDGLTGSLAALEMGDPQGPPLLAVHGWLDNAASFIPLAEQLPGYRWVALDLAGHGRSDHRPPGSVYHFTDYIGDLYRAADSLGLEQFSLVGHSLGAGVSAAFAASFPERVGKLVMIDGIGPISGRDQESLAQLRKSMAFLGQAPAPATRAYPDWPGLVRRRMQAGDIRQHSVEILLGRGTETRDGKVVVLSDGRLKQHSPIYMGQEKVLSILGGIEASTLLVIARDGLIASRETTHERIRVVPDITVVEVDGAHHVHLDDPGPTAGHLQAFLGP